MARNFQSPDKVKIWPWGAFVEYGAYMALWCDRSTSAQVKYCISQPQWYLRSDYVPWLFEETLI